MKYLLFIFILKIEWDYTTIFPTVFMACTVTALQFCHENVQET